MSTVNDKRHCGDLVSANHALPPVRIDASEWPREAGPRTAGVFVGASHALAGVKVNMLLREKVLLDLTLTLSDTDQAESAANGDLSTMVTLVTRDIKTGKHNIRLPLPDPEQLAKLMAAINALLSISGTELRFHTAPSPPDSAQSPTPASPVSAKTPPRPA
jgi:hypothetical protein